MEKSGQKYIFMAKIEPKLIVAVFPQHRPKFKKQRVYGAMIPLAIFKRYTGASKGSRRADEFIVIPPS